MLENRMVIDSEWPEPATLPHVHCCKCGADLQYGNELYDPDEAFSLDGAIYCEDCFVDAAKDMFRTRLEV